MNYLKESDFWKKTIYVNENFNSNLNELTLINAQINQIIFLYDVLGRDIEDNFLDDVKEQINLEKSKNNENNIDIKNEILSNNYTNNNNYVNVDDDNKYDNKEDNNDDYKDDNNGDNNDDNDDDDEDDPFEKKEDEDDDDDRD